jgi:UDP-N-acetylglucosamine transferase subunit ALG13
VGNNEKCLSKSRLRGVHLLIFVALGTHELPFTRLLKEIEILKKNGAIKEEVIIQTGHTPFKSEVLTIKPFLKFDEMEKLFDEARIVITHAGAGSMINAIKKGKKVIAAARLKKYNEHNDDHQLELIEEFTNAGYILSWAENENLEEVIKKIETFVPNEFISGKKAIVDIITNFIENI